MQAHSCLQSSILLEPQLSSTMPHRKSQYLRQHSNLENSNGCLFASLEVLSFVWCAHPSSQLKLYMDVEEWKIVVVELQESLPFVESTCSRKV
jgi:hypothetical protein